MAIDAPTSDLVVGLAQVFATIVIALIARDTRRRARTKQKRQALRSTTPARWFCSTPAGSSVRTLTGSHCGTRPLPAS